MVRGGRAGAGAPGLDLPSLETARIAEAYGVTSRPVSERAALREALADGIASSSPNLVEARVAPGMSVF